MVKKVVEDVTITPHSDQENRVMIRFETKHKLQAERLQLVMRLDKLDALDLAHALIEEASKIE